MEVIATFQGNRIFFSACSLADIMAMSLDGLPKYFTCAFFLHNTDWSKPEMKAVVKRLIDTGAVYLKFHGNRCEEACFVADRVVHAHFEGEETDQNVIMTTENPGTDLEDMAFEVLLIGMPTADDYYESWAGYLIVSIGSQSDNQMVKQLFSHPQASTIHLGPRTAREWFS